MPATVRKWSVVVDGREFPVKQLVREAANQLPGSDFPVTPADLTAHDAVRYLRRHGFGGALRYMDSSVSSTSGARRFETAPAPQEAPPIAAPSAVGATPSPPAPLGGTTVEATVSPETPPPTEPSRVAQSEQGTPIPANPPPLPPSPPPLPPAPQQSAQWAAVDQLDRKYRTRLYLADAPPAVAGQHGAVHTFQTCCRLIHGFNLDDDEAFQQLAEWNAKCQPPWSEQELRDTIRWARRYGRDPEAGSS